MAKNDLSDGNEFLTPAQVAKLLSISRQTLNDWVRDNKIPSIQISRSTRRFARVEIEEWLRQSRSRNGAA